MKSERNRFIMQRDLARPGFLGYRVAEPKRDNLAFRIFQPIVKLHGPVICHKNGNSMGFQNMSDFKMSDH